MSGTPATTVNVCVSVCNTTVITLLQLQFWLILGSSFTLNGLCLALVDSLHIHLEVHATNYIGDIFKSTKVSRFLNYESEANQYSNTRMTVYSFVSPRSQATFSFYSTC